MRRCLRHAVRQRSTPALVAALLGTACLPVAAQGRSFWLTPTFDTTLTWTEDVRRGERQPSDLITQLRPGVVLGIGTGRLRGSLSYGLNSVHHTREGAPSELQNNLTGSFSAEVADNWLFVDGSANVSQRAISAFGAQTADNGTVNSNRVEVGTVNITPHARGRLGDLARFDLSVSASATNTRKSAVGDSSSTATTFSLDSANPGAVLGWGGSLSAQQVAYRGGRSNESSRATASVLLRPDTDYNFVLRAGQERTNTVDVASTSYTNWGATARWTPSGRTTATLDTDRRYFGQSNRLLLEHRLPQSSFRFTSTRDVTNGADPNGVGQPVTAYQLLDSVLKSTYPDPVARDEAVREVLRAEGRDGNAIVAGGFINRGATLQRREDLAWTYGGRRLSLTLQAFASKSTQLGVAGGQAAGNDVQQRGWNTSASYRLTPTASVTLSTSGLKTSATATQGGNDLKSLSLGWTDQLGPHIALSLGGRYSVFNSPTDPYREAAVTASLSLRF